MQADLFPAPYGGVFGTTFVHAIDPQAIRNNVTGSYVRPPFPVHPELRRVCMIDLRPAWFAGVSLLGQTGFSPRRLGPLTAGGRLVRNWVWGRHVKLANTLDDILAHALETLRRQRDQAKPPIIWR